ncbi:alanyl-tRNA editing protein [Microbaculum sp. FT89]|uniref:alanyl-tRNA editing protein n=1 Tax=Microbaculum sp. FT89 TaxID=3447298 RepID=UPI003F53001C
MPETEPLFRDDAYRKSCEATVLGVNDRGGIVLDRTVFYPTGGGQPGDKGTLTLEDGTEIPVATAVKGDAPGEIVHVPAEPGPLPEPGDTVEAKIDWETRYRRMRVHTALHLLSVAMPHPVTGGQISDDYGRLDFAIEGTVPQKEELTEQLNALISGDHLVTTEWITDAELEANPDLVKTMSVKPPMGAGKVRLVRIGQDVDLQPCGGTHVAQTGEIGAMVVTKMESKGAQNRRVRIAFTDGG